jgi:hypothetical protein
MKKVHHMAHAETANICDAEGGARKSRPLQRSEGVVQSQDILRDKKQEKQRLLTPRQLMEKAYSLMKRREVVPDRSKSAVDVLASISEEDISRVKIR